MALTSKLTAIADAIRAKTGETGKMTLEQMPAKIGRISGGGGGGGGGGGFDTSQLGTCSFNTDSGAIDLTGLDTSNFLVTTSMFDSCANVTSLDLSSLDFSKVFDMSRMFCGCAKLEMIAIGSFPLGLQAADDFISGCDSLTVFRVGRDSDTKPQDCIFSYDGSKENYPTDFQIQVPAHLVDAYKADSSWADYVDQIVPRP